MSTDLGASFNEQYMNINTKLKKRFMRKPNISEATNEFLALAIQCEHSEQPAFAGQAYIGAAKCEASVGHFLGEAEHNLAAARQFMKAEQRLKQMKFSSPDRENLEASIGCYMQALSKYPSASPLRTSILMELAESLVQLDHKMEALAYFHQALVTVTVHEQTRRMMFMRKLLDLQIDCEKYEEALETANQMADSHSNLPEDILTEIQVSRVLLTLHTEVSEDLKPASLRQLFTDILSEDDVGLPFNPDLHLKLQSLIYAITMSDVANLMSVSQDLKKFLSVAQVDLMDAIVHRIRKIFIASA